MIAVDTNILVYAHREDSPHHVGAFDALRGLATARRPWAVPWPCLHEFFSIVTHRRVYAPPSDPGLALSAIEAILRSPGVQMLGEAPDHAQILGDLIRVGRVVGPRVHDARIAAICLGHGVEQLWTADRDFSCFPALRTANPLA